VDVEQRVSPDRGKTIAVRQCGRLVSASLLSAVVLQAAGPRLPLGLDLYRPEPHDNRLTAGKIELGRRLFFDRRLSRDGSLSCASCHDPSRAFSNSRPHARGVDGAIGVRNVPTLVNRAWGTRFFWDGRAATLEQQVLEPILNPKELASTEARVVALVGARDYRSEFRATFGAEPGLVDASRALASFVRTIVSGNAPYDRYVSGVPSALDSAARRGLALFAGKAACNTCHTGPFFTDEQFHNTGVAWRLGTLTDPGRAGVTGADGDRGAFKTPTLRDVSRTAPYMHDGSFPTLADVIDFYDRGGRRNPGVDPKLRALHLTRDEKLDLLAFLNSLTGQITAGRY
jgi:cytochrome c peroxidase